MARKRTTVTRLGSFSPLIVKQRRLFALTLCGSRRFHLDHLAPAANGPPACRAGLTDAPVWSWGRFHEAVKVFSYSGCLAAVYNTRICHAEGKAKVEVQHAVH